MKRHRKGLLIGIVAVPLLSLMDSTGQSILHQFSLSPTHAGRRLAPRRLSLRNSSSGHPFL